MEKDANKCIECSVTQCAHHCGDKNFCSLRAIRVGTHESNPTMYQCTDCNSFELRNSTQRDCGCDIH